jgi:hypothetical protein
MTSEIFELQVAYGEQGYLDSRVNEIIEDVLPNLDRPTLEKLYAAIDVQLRETSEHYTDSIPF